MKTAGIICEYNPFHSGHKYQLAAVKRDFDAVICIMSGSFVQRGEVAVFDKWTRAKAALENGADLVIELPVRAVLSSAEGFAAGGIGLLNSLGIADALFFGSECGDINTLRNCAEVILNEPPEVSEKIKELSKEGFGFAKARAYAYKDILDEKILSTPNNILAIEYIKALIRTNSSITPVTLKRRGAGYNDTAVVDGFASATMLREKIKVGEDISDFSPFDFSREITYDTDKLTNIFKYKLITQGVDAFSSISDVEVGLDNRFIRAVDAGSLSDIIDRVKTKRYARTRLSRIAMRVLLDLKDAPIFPEYVRILGFNDTGKRLLSKMKASCILPVVNKVADFDSAAILPDILATDIAALCASTHVPQGRDYTTSPIITA